MAKRKSNVTGGITAFAILSVVSLVLFTVYVKESQAGPLHTVQLGASEVLRPARSVVGVAAGPFNAVGNWFGGSLGAAKKESDLEKEVIKYREEAADAARLKQENQRLLEMLNGQRLAYKYAPLARVVAPIGGQLTNRVIINIGSKDGVKPEQPVVVGDNTLVGRTTGRVTENTAEVMLITDQSFAAGVKIVPPTSFNPKTGGVQAAGGDVSYGEGLLKTNWEGYLGVDFVDLNARVERGDYVITSGKVGERQLLFPPGLLIGKVESVSSQDIDQYKKIVVSPAVRSNELEEVRVIVGW